MGKKYSDEKVICSFFLAISLVFIAASFFTGPVEDLLHGFSKILTSSQVLTTDACALGGLNGALLNAGLLGLAAWALMKIFGAKISGASVGAFFLTLGFSFFGKNCLNVWPIIFGIWLYSRLKKEPFGKYVNMSLFACSLAPFISEAIFNRHLDYSTGIGILIALLIGIAIGLIFPPLTAHTVSTHKGHDLFNAGVSAGFLAFLFFTIYKTLALKPMGLEAEYALNSILSEGFPLFFVIFIGVICLLAIVVGFVFGGSLKGYGKLVMRSGHGTDFLALDGAGNVLINFGLMGIIFLAYFLIVKAPFTGPTVGALLCLLCWAANGSHPLNVIPIVIGYGLVSTLAVWDLGTQAIAVGLCFASGLSPISGRWGWYWGVVAGAFHACLVTYTASLHGGFNIYNGGFTAGLVALVLVPILETYFRDLATRRGVQSAGIEKSVS